MATLQIWRRSTSPQLELNRTTFWSGVKDHCSTSQLPGVRSLGAPPSTESAYRCCQPSSSEAITIWLSAAQFKTPPPVSPAMYGNEPWGVVLLCQISFAECVDASATQ